MGKKHVGLILVMVLVLLVTQQGTVGSIASSKDRVPQEAGITADKEYDLTTAMNASPGEDIIPEDRKIDWS
jgi:hypothetical protein